MQQLLTGNPSFDFSSHEHRYCEIVCGPDSDNQIAHVPFYLAMGIVEGFDMVPRLTRNREDVNTWELLIGIIQNYCQDDPQVKLRDGYIEFEAGEHPLLPFDGYKFLRFSSKISGQIATKTNVERYLRNGDVAITPKHFAGDTDDYPIMILNDTFFERMKVEGKGNGLVARCNIRRGTRILFEAPLLVASSTSPEKLHQAVATQLKTSLTEAQKRQFLSLHNNFPGQHAFAGIMRTNALPCGEREGGVYAVLSLVNHSCLANCHASWNAEARREALHACADVLAGEELTISYDAPGDALAPRQAWLRANFGFGCRCELCVGTPADVCASDARRARIKRLYNEAGNPLAMITEPLASLRACRELVAVLTEEYGAGTGAGDAAARLASVYYDAFQIVVAHGDQARAKVFAERAYEARAAVEGEDNPESKRIKGFAEDPSSHLSFATGSKNWKASKASQPSNLGVAEFENWLWRQ